MFARMVLPMLGGAPAVWNTAMVFYQGTLLAGYLYAHASSRWLSIRQQVLVHLVMIVLPFAALPIGVPIGTMPPTNSSPVPWLLGMLAAGAGIPFFVVSSTSPLLQSWYAAQTDKRTANPYALYAASNAGSMLALIGYPFLVEPLLSLRQQSRLWSFGYVALALLILTVTAMLMRRRRDAAVDAPRLSPHALDAPELPLTVARRMRWVMLAFVPSSLMLSVTLYMSTNIAPIPLLWVGPLALYLLTFIVAFASRQFVSRAVLARCLPFAILPVLVAILADASQPIRVLLALHLLAFTAIALICHATLAAEAPEARQLTEFYLWLSVGGALGGVFNAVIAPALFDSVLEYPIVLALTAALVTSGSASDRTDVAAATDPPPEPGSARLLDVVLPLAVVPLVPLLALCVRQLGIEDAGVARLLTLGIPAMLCFTFSERRLRFALGLTALVAGSASFDRDRHVLRAERSFFGISRVLSSPSGMIHELVHGNITHGAQDLRPAYVHDPLTYYTRSGPIGQLFTTRQAAGTLRRVGVVGLGAGSLACYRRTGESWTFFEIDPAVLRIARDARYFTYLRDCAPDANIVLGDARLSLVAERDSAYDLIVLDAYSADAIPVHLLTREALALYRRKLADGGVIALHVSNRFFDLGPVIDALARDVRMHALRQDDNRVTTEEAARGKAASDWIILARRSSDFGPLLSDARWRALVTQLGSRVWTDDFSSTLRALR